MRLLSEERLVDDRRRLEGFVGVVERFVERLAGGQPALGRILGGVLGRRGLAVERPPEAAQDGLQVGTGIRVQRRQNPVELDRAGRVGGGKRLAAVECGRAGRAGLQIDVVAALEEQARADVGGRVGVNWQRVAVDVHRHDRRARRALHHLDRRHLADIDASDPNRRVEVQFGLGREGRLEHIRRGSEWDRASEHEVADHADHDDRDQARNEVRDQRPVASHEPLFFVVSVARRSLPGGLPSTARLVR